MTQLDQTLAEYGAPLPGAAVYNYNPAFVEIAAHLGFRVLWFEMEHAQTPLDRIADMCRIASGLHLLTMIRIPDSRRESVLRAAECGPDILDLPMANTPEILEELVAHARYAPLGARGFFGASRAVRYGMCGDIAEEQCRINRELCLMTQIETAEAVERAEELCAVAQINGIFLGPGDLSASYGVTGKTGHPLVVEAMERTIATAKACGKRVALFSGAGDAGRWAEKGADVIFFASDVAALRSGAQSVLSQFQASLAKARGASQ